MRSARITPQCATNLRGGKSCTENGILHKLSAYPRQNCLSAGLRELGRIERCSS
nr:Tn3 family transposase [Paraburkholderia sp. USG1]